MVIANCNRRGGDSYIDPVLVLQLLVLADKGLQLLVLASKGFTSKEYCS